MRAAVLASLAAVACLSVPAGVRAIVLDVTQDQAYRAIAIGRSSNAERASFHARYLVAASDPLIERLEVLTPFRRVVMETERRLGIGDHLFGANEAAGAIKAWRSKLTIVVKVRLHPQNVYLSLPTYETILASPRGDEARLGDVRRTPLWSSGPHPSLMGGVIESDFDLAAVGQTTRVVSVVLDGKTLARATIIFSQLD